MKKGLLIFGVSLLMLIGVAFVWDTVSAIGEGDQIFPVFKKDKTTELPLSAQQMLYNELKVKSISQVGEGWLYMREFVNYDVDMPSEEGEMPLLDTRTESWFYINAAGMVEKSISIGTAGNNSAPLIGVFNNGTSWDTVADEILSTPSYKFEAFDYGLSAHLQDPELKTEKITSQSGATLTKFSIKYIEQKPTKLSVYTKKFISMTYEFIFNDATGFVSSVNVIVEFEDDTKRNFYTVRVEQIQFNTQPSADAFKYFEIKNNKELLP